MRSYTLGYSKAGRSEQRRDKRLKLPIFSVRIGDQRYDSINWSLGGMLIGGYDGFLFQGLSVVIQVRLRDVSRVSGDAADDSDLVIEALVIRNDLEKRELALKFQRLTPTILDFFERSFAFHRSQHR